MTLGEMTIAEAKAYRMICEAADRGLPCPQNIDLEIEAGFNSCSMGSKLVARLEAKGYLIVKRFQKYRQVQVIATGVWTARPTQMRVDRPHVPKGRRSGHAGDTHRKRFRDRLG